MTDFFPLAIAFEKAFFDREVERKRLKNKTRNIRFTKKPNYNKFRETIRKTIQKNKKRKTCKKYKITSGNNRNYKKHKKHKKTQRKQRKHSRK
jgi:hypothetical protein